jgi:ubiquinone/menaquinone biosynthesis C-methylase UbiE
VNETYTNINEQKAAAAFTQQATVFDQLYSGNTIVQYKRERVRHHVKQWLGPGSFILELNSGTGEDAIWFAKQGHRVHATDISAGMLEKMLQKLTHHDLHAQVSHELISFTELHHLFNRGPYDLIFSNFAGLNCTHELDKVLHSFSPLLKPNGIVTLVILPKFCLWEFLLLFKGKFKTAFRRFFSRKGRKAHVEGQYFRCWYYNPSYIIRNMKKEFELLSIEGLCSLVPPSYIENFAEKHARSYRWLKNKEDKWKSKWPWKYIGDYYIISLRRKN